jgi:2-phosphosulfolactate phosphatase
VTRVELDWGPTGGERAARLADVTVVVDVLSFTTCVSMAVDRGIAVHPYRWRDETARQYAERVGAVLAVARGVPGGVSLSPGSIAAVRGVERIVLPSPNGSTVAHLVAATGSTVVAGALRNRRAVARWVAEQAHPPAAVAVVAAGERWPDGSLRPAVEDLWGAGAVVAALAEWGIDDLSPEASAAAAAFREVEDAPDLAAALAACASGRELADRGYADDVRLAARLDVSDAVPVLDASLGSFSRSSSGLRAAGRTESR